MIILRCDICEEDIKGRQMASSFNYFEQPQMFIQGSPETEQQIKQVEQMFCEKCTDKIKKHRDELATK